MSIERIKTAIAGPDFSPLPVVEYEYGADDQAVPYGQTLTVPADGTVESDEFDFKVARIQVTVDCFYTVGGDPIADENDGGRTDILFAGIPYHELFDPSDVISLKSVDGSEGMAFIRPVKEVVND